MKTKKVPARKTVRKKKTLKMVIAVRHGDCDDLSKELCPFGIQQVSALVEAIRNLTTDKTVGVVSSTVVRGWQSADIIARALGTSVERSGVLTSDNYNDGEELMKELLARRDGAEVIVAVTHYEAPSGIINAFRQKHFQKGFDCLKSWYGDGCLINLETGEVRRTLLS